MVYKYLQRKFHEASLVGNPLFFYKLPRVGRDLADCFPLIRQELKALVDTYESMPHFHKVSPQEAYISQDDKWRMLFLYALGWNIKENQEKAPITMQILHRHPNVVSAYISCLGPRKMLKPHYGPWAGIMRMHLPITVPGNGTGCFLRVHKTTASDPVDHYWKEGRPVMFDDTYLHYAVNKTDEVRAVLMLDIIRPMREPWNTINRMLIWLSGYTPDTLGKVYRYWKHRRQHKTTKE